MLSESEMCAAVAARDPRADGAFFYAVLTTGVFCFPSCKARPARPENLRFFATRAEALAAGYRACKRCRPLEPPLAERQADWVRDACAAMRAGTFDLALASAHAGLGEARFSRMFRAVTGVTPAAYARGLRQAQLEAGLQSGAPVTQAFHDAGFGSSSRFYESADAMLGMTPTAYRPGGAGERIGYAVVRCALGLVLVAQAGRGICAILLGDAAEALTQDLARRFPRAALVRSDDFADQVAAVVALIETPAAGHTLPLDVRGTLFQRRVWQALRGIKPGETAPYGAIAAQLGRPNAARAVGAACAANPLAVAIPCHRAVAKDGAPPGYRWGQHRKLALLQREVPNTPQLRTE